MPAATFRVFIKAPPEKVFPFVGNLLRHPDWATDPMKMEARPSGSFGIGNQYRSTTNFRGMVVVAELQVVEYQPPTRFAFKVNVGLVDMLTNLCCMPRTMEHSWKGLLPMKEQTSSLKF